MKNKEYLVALRRGIGLGLALVALWAMTLLTDTSKPRKLLEEWGAQASLAVSMLQTQMPPSAQAQASMALTGWGRLLLEDSPLLAAGEQAVLELRATQLDGENEPDFSNHEQDGDDLQMPNLTPSRQGEQILETTSRGKQGGKYLFSQGVYVYDRTNLALDDGVFTSGKVDFPIGEGPQILIVHTHGSEAYSQTDGDYYDESDAYRTTDCTHNVVKVGEEIATVFRAHGFQVLHDTTLFDYPAYNGAYDRSKLAVQQWLEQYPSIKIVLDVHRDALEGSEGEVYKLVSEEAGAKVAQVMLVVGSSGAGAEHPHWRDNLAFAIRLQQGLQRGFTSLARPIVVRNSRYNQELSTGSLLVEVGGHGNTLTEAIDGGRLWADNVARTLLEMK